MHATLLRTGHWLKKITIQNDKKSKHQKDEKKLKYLTTKSYTVISSSISLHCERNVPIMKTGSIKKPLGFNCGNVRWQQHK